MNRLDAAMNGKFKVSMRGSFHTYELHDADGKEIFDLNKACEEAEWQFPRDWSEVFNGDVGTSRNEYLDLD